MNFRSAHRRRAWIPRPAPCGFVSPALRCRSSLWRRPALRLAACRAGGFRRLASISASILRSATAGPCGSAAWTRPARIAGRRKSPAPRKISSSAACSAGKRISIVLAGATDRWGRTIADLSLPEPAAGSAGSTAAALLAAGLARVRPEFETRGCAAERLKIEDGARRAALGVWRDPDFAVDPVVRFGRIAPSRRLVRRRSRGGAAGLALRARAFILSLLRMTVPRS